MQARGIRSLGVLIALLEGALAVMAQMGMPVTQAEPQRDGQHDWDTFFGTWKMHLKRRLRPLSGSNEWQEFESHDLTRKIWDGRANLDELEADGPSGHIEGLTVRLYNPRSHQWSIYWANASAPTLDIPTIGTFQNGRGEFYDQEMFHQRAIFVRYVWTDVSEKSGDFEQSFSADGGKTWEANWVTTMERETPSKANVAPNPDNHDGQHDFDFEFGRWKVHLKRLIHPLSKSKDWKEYDGTCTVSPLWNGRANFAEFEAANGSDRIEGLSLRLFDPHTRQWSIWWANAGDGILDRIPVVGSFEEAVGERSRAVESAPRRLKPPDPAGDYRRAKALSHPAADVQSTSYSAPEDGPGEFLGFQQVDGRWVLVRFVFSGISANTMHGEQSYSLDGGKTWEPNWIEDLRREWR